MVSLRPIVRHRRWIVALYVAAAAVCAPGLLRLRIDNAPQGFFVRDAVALERLRRLELDYGRDRLVRLVLDGGELWSREGLARLAELEEAASDPKRVGGGVYGAAGLVRHHRWHLETWPPPDPVAFRKLAIDDPVDRNVGWVDGDARTVTVAVGLFRMPPERERPTLERLEALLSPPRPPARPAPPARDGPTSSAAARDGGGRGVSGYMTGLPVVVRALDEALVGLAGRFFPLLLLVATALLLVLFPPTRRRPIDALLPLALVAVTQTVLYGVMGYAGQHLDFITMVLAPLLFVIGLATGIHVLAHHRRRQAGKRDRSAGEAVLATYRVKAWPVLWTGLTTCAGFGSLAVAETPPVRTLGLWAAFGIAYLTLAALSFYPALLALAGGERAVSPVDPRAGDPGDAGSSAPRRRGGAVPALSRLGRAWAGWAVARRHAVYGLFGAVALLAALGLPRLTVETTALGYFRPDHPVRTGIVDLEERGIGTVSASLALAFPEDGAADDPETLRRLKELSAALREDPRVLGTLSAGDLVTNTAGYLPEPSRDEARASPDPLVAARARMDRERDLAALLSVVRSHAGDRTRVILFTRFLGHAELDPLFARAEELARRAFPEAEVHVTGLYPLILASQRSVLRTMVLSLGLAVLVIAAILRGLLGSVSLTLRALVANAWPVLLVLGAMGWLGVPVNGATVMIGAVVLGLAVDDTLHTLGHYRRAVARRRDAVDSGEAAVEALAETSPGHVATSAILALGFGTCALSSLVPVARFGALAACGIAGALAADLFLVPALLAGSRRPMV